MGWELELADHDRVVEAEARAWCPGRAQATIMKAILSPTMALMALGLAACSSETPQTPPTETADMALTTPQASEAAVSSPTATPTPGASEGPIVREIPLALRGRWGLVPGDCTSTRGDAKGLLAIAATDLRFYESVGKIVTATSVDPDRLRGTFAFTGEGMEWTRDISLQTSADGKTLEYFDMGTDAPPSHSTYARCD